MDDEKVLEYVNDVSEDDDDSSEDDDEGAKLVQQIKEEHLALTKKHEEEMRILEIELGFLDDPAPPAKMDDEVSSQIISKHLDDPAPPAKKPQPGKFFDFFQPIGTSIENSTEKYT